MFYRGTILTTGLDITYSFDILVKNVTVFCSCSKNLPGTMLKNIVLISLTVVESVVRLLVITDM